VLERGYIDSFDNFNLGGRDTPMSYTAMLYNSSIIPCPRGARLLTDRIRLVCGIVRGSSTRLSQTCLPALLRRRCNEMQEDAIATQHCSSYLQFTPCQRGVPCHSDQLPHT